MKIKELITLCENVTPKTNIMVFATVEDYDFYTPFWQGFTAEQLKDCENLVAKFKISPYQNLLVIALA